MLPHSLDSLGQCKLLSRNTANKPPSSNLAAHLEPPIYGQQIAPRGRDGLACQKIAEHHTVSSQQQPSPLLGSFLGAYLLHKRWKPRPPAALRIRRLVALRPPSPPTHRVSRLGTQPAYCGKSIRRDQSQCGQLAQGIFQLRRQQFRHGQQVIEKQRSMIR
jgi:hypothetical protein